MNPELARIGVVIVTFESEGTVGRTLDALPLADLGGVIVVDNASRDRSADTARTRPTVRVLVNAANVGFGEACNLGRAQLQSEIDRILFLNPDAVVGSDSLRRMAAHLEQNPSCGVVAPRLFDEAGPLTSAGRLGTLGTEARTICPAFLARRLPDRRLPPTHDISGPVGYVEGACMLASANAFDSVGGFDQAYFLFYEEMDLAHRLRVRGWTVDLCAEAEALHLRGVSRSAVPHLVSEAMARSAIRYLNRWCGRSAGAVYRALTVLNALQRVARGRWSSAQGSAALRAALRPGRRYRGSLPEN